MNQAGVKVDAVEVTVGGHEFEKNLEQNAKQEETAGRGAGKASANATRRHQPEMSWTDCPES